MSRYSDFGDYDESNRNLWEGALAKALYSPKGLRRLREFEEILVAMPDKRLIAGDIGVKPCEQYPAGAVCFVGAILRAKNPDHLDKYRVPFDRRDEGEFDLCRTGEIGKVAGIPYSLGWQMGYQNDEEWAGCTDLQRYIRALAWVRAKIAEAERRLAPVAA